MYVFSLLGVMDKFRWFDIFVMIVMIMEMVIGCDIEEMFGVVWGNMICV